ncbi:protein CDI-like [Musa acuminata AAA Group]|uniref:protein CDI-like n=1 Tax=Musa acuminata AAA Group TaxID=214697 RepID=UPI0031D49375
MAIGQANGAAETNGKPPGLAAFRIFVGYDSREDAAFQVCRHSLLRRSSVPLEVIPLKQAELRAAGLYTRGRGATESTEFSFTRFLTPFLAGYQGWAMFVDCDFLFTADVAELSAMADDRYAVMCVHHDYAPKEGVKMDGVPQTVYPRKNWSSMVLYNCAHPKNRALTPELVSAESGAFLHRFMWLDDDDVGELPVAWNFLVGHNRVDPTDPKTQPKAIHYTSGGPWFEAYRDCEFGDLWLKELEELNDEKQQQPVEL